jgi:hypothetical protein
VPTPGAGERKEQQMRNKIMLLVAALATVFGVSLAAAPSAQAVSWSNIITHSDFAGNGQLQVNYRILLGDNVGFYVESIKICADDSGLFYHGIDGRGLSVSNENEVKWSTTNTNLGKGDCRSFDFEMPMTHSATLKVGWLFSDIFIPGDDINHCARLTIHHSDWDSGC